MDSAAGGSGVDRKINKEDVISKFKDDGDFDKLRVKIIRKLKDNEDLRNSIISMVKQSATLNRPGIENMKPRQISEAIHQEVGEKVMNQISDGVWEIIRSGDEMRNEIRESVQSVYSRLLNPEGSGGGEASHNNDSVAIQKIPANNGSVPALPNEVDGIASDNEPIEPPGFALPSPHQDNQHEEQLKEEHPLDVPQDKLPVEKDKEEAHCSHDMLAADAMNPATLPAISTITEQKEPGDGSDEDLDVPPGFG